VSDRHFLNLHEKINREARVTQQGTLSTPYFLSFLPASWFLSSAPVSVKEQQSTLLPSALSPTPKHAKKGANDVLVLTALGKTVASS